METVYTQQANVVRLPMCAKATGDPITTGTVNFYLIDDTGPNAGKWYRGSDQTWQASESIAGAASHDSDGHWKLSLPSAVWTANAQYMLYGKESGDLHIVVEIGLDCKSKAHKAFAAWLLGNWRDKSGSPGTYEILDPDDGSTVIAEITPSTTTPYKTVTIL